MEPDELYEICQELFDKLEDLPESPDKVREILVAALAKLPGGMGVVSDGHHTFDELYDHRRGLTAVLATVATGHGASWKSRHHHPDDETPMFEGCFIVGIELPTGDIRYHYGVEHWDEFPNVPEVPYAPLWDGQGPAETLVRLRGAAEIPVLDQEG